MNIYQSLFFSITLCLSLASCQSEAEEVDTHTRASDSNIIYLDQITTKSDEASITYQDIISSGHVFVDFYADWCGPCRNLSSAIERIAPQFPNVTFLKVDIDQFRTIAKGIRSIPAIRLYKNGKHIYSQTGALSAPALEKLLKKQF